VINFDIFSSSAASISLYIKLKLVINYGIFSPSARLVATHAVGYLESASLESHSDGAPYPAIPFARQTARSRWESHLSAYQFHFLGSTTLK